MWMEKKLLTIGDIMDAMLQIMNANNDLLAHEFMDLYRYDNANAEVNIGYLTGYFSEENMRKAQRMFRVKHPIFGDSAPSALEAFKMGHELGVKSLKVKHDEDTFLSDLEKI